MEKACARRRIAPKPPPMVPVARARRPAGTPPRPACPGPRPRTAAPRPGPRGPARRRTSSSPLPACNTTLVAASVADDADIAAGALVRARLPRRALMATLRASPTWLRSSTATATVSPSRMPAPPPPISAIGRPAPACPCPTSDWMRNSLISRRAPLKPESQPGPGGVPVGQGERDVGDARALVLERHAQSAAVVVVRPARSGTGRPRRARACCGPARSRRSRSWSDPPG